MLAKFHDSLVFFVVNGQGVKMEELATFLPELDMERKLKLSAQIASQINNQFNQNGAFKGIIKK